MKSVSELKVQIFADGADKASMLELYRQSYIKGFTTNPTLMRKAGVTDYERFAREILQSIPDRPISFEVFADDESEMERQARKIARWASNVYVKIPVTNTRSAPMYELIRRLSAEGIQVNATAVLALDQVRHIAQALRGGAPSYISVFAGRVADTGRDPVPVMKSALELMAAEPNAQLVWASPRELLNIFQADEIGCHIITVTSDVLKKLSLVGKDLHEYSLETVRMFRNDAAHSKFKLELTAEERPVGSLR
jgi:transaldolase